VSKITESAIESAALAWLEAIGWHNALHNTLLSRLISGALRVKGAERFLPERRR